MDSWLQPVAAVAAGGEVEFPILLFICPENRRLSPWKPNMSITFFPCPGQDGKNQSIFELIDVGTSRPCPWQVLDGHFRVIFDAVHRTWTNESRLVVIYGNMAIQKSCSCRVEDGFFPREMAPWMMARRKPHQGSSKPWKSSFSTVCQVHWYPDWPYQWFRIIKLMWIKMDGSIATN